MIGLTANSLTRCSVVLLVLIALTLTQTACPGDGGKQPTREDYLQYARETVAGLRDVSPILKANQISTVKLDVGIEIGDRLVTVFANGVHQDALLLTGELIAAFEEAQAEFELIKDRKVQTAVLVGLAVAKVSLRRLADLVDKGLVALDQFSVRVTGVNSFQDQSAKSKAEQAREKVRQFKKKKQWRCKNATTGRFEKMEFCKANPDRSFVVTFVR